MTRMFWATLAVLFSVLATQAVANPISYQGRLDSEGTPAVGEHQFLFLLFPQQFGGAPVADTVIRVLDIPASANGSFSFNDLDFGIDPWDGDPRFLEVRVRPGTSGPVTILSPRQPVTPTPYALHAFSASALSAGDGGEVSIGSSLLVEGESLTVLGGVSAFSFDGSATGDGALSLPMQSVSAMEIFNEAGIAANIQPQVFLSSANAPSAIRSITVPGPGHVLVMAQADLVVQSISGFGGTVVWGVSDEEDTIPENNDIQFSLPGSDVGVLAVPAQAQAFFEVAEAGTFTYYLVARSIGWSNPRFFDVQLSLIYFPTAYGDVDVSARLNPLGLNDHPQLGPGVLTQADIDAEKAAERARTIRVLREEQARIRELLDQVRATTEELESESPEAPATE